MAAGTALRAAASALSGAVTVSALKRRIWKRLTYQSIRSNPLAVPAAPRAVLLFDIDGVIRDVGASYRRAIVETVRHFSGWAPDPAAIDALKSEGCWNNDWQASLELLRRRGQSPLPAYEVLVEVFSGFYFGGDPAGDPSLWRGFIGSEPLLVDGPFFAALSGAGIAWGFVSGAEPPSARYVLEQRLGLAAPPLIAMGEAPDKPDPTGLLDLAATLAGVPLGAAAPPVAYLGDTVADVETVRRARGRVAAQRFEALAVAPPHLQQAGREDHRRHYEEQLRRAGADRILTSTRQVLDLFSAPSPPVP
jgi:HAD superfamily phosphatase